MRMTGPKMARLKRLLPVAETVPPTVPGCPVPLAYLIHSYDICTVCCVACIASVGRRSRLWLSAHALRPHVSHALRGTSPILLTLM